MIELLERTTKIRTIIVIIKRKKKKKKKILKKKKKKKTQETLSHNRNVRKKINQVYNIRHC